MQLNVPEETHRRLRSMAASGELYDFATKCLGIEVDKRFSEWLRVQAQGIAIAKPKK